MARWALVLALAAVVPTAGAQPSEGSTIEFGTPSAALAAPYEEFRVPFAVRLYLSPVSACLEPGPIEMEILGPEFALSVIVPDSFQPQPWIEAMGGAYQEFEGDMIIVVTDLAPAFQTDSYDVRASFVGCNSPPGLTGGTETQATLSIKYDYYAALGVANDRIIPPVLDGPFAWNLAITNRGNGQTIVGFEPDPRDAAAFVELPSTMSLDSAAQQGPDANDSRSVTAYLDPFYDYRGPVLLAVTGRYAAAEADEVSIRLEETATVPLIIAESAGPAEDLAELPAPGLMAPVLAAALALLWLRRR